MISEKKSGAPYLNVWFGNFYRPAYDDQAFVAEGMELLKKFGFNSVLLDSKDWEDFRERYEGKPASQFVGMQEFMMEQIKKQGLSHTFLAIYLNADNLYPNIRFSPPVFGESVVTAKGNDGRWYRYWSEKAPGDDDGACFAAFRDVRRKYDPDRSGRERKETAVQHVGPGRCTELR